MWPAIYLLSAFVFVAVVSVNVWYWRRRAGLSAEDRRAEDFEDRCDAQLW